MRSAHVIAQSLRKLAKRSQPVQADLLVRRLQKDYLDALFSPGAESLLEKEFGDIASAKKELTTRIDSFVYEIDSTVITVRVFDEFLPVLSTFLGKLQDTLKNYGWFVTYRMHEQDTLALFIAPYYTNRVSPKSIFHVTPQENVAAIQKKGLQPRPSRLGREYPNRIYFVETKDLAYSVIKDLHGVSKEKTPYAMLQVNPTKLDKGTKFFRDPEGDGDHFFWTYSPIPASAIQTVEVERTDDVVKSDNTANNEFPLLAPKSVDPDDNLDWERAREGQIFGLLPNLWESNETTEVRQALRESIQRGYEYIREETDLRVSEAGLDIVLTLKRVNPDYALFGMDPRPTRASYVEYSGYDLPPSIVLEFYHSRVVSNFENWSSYKAAEMRPLALVVSVRKSKVKTPVVVVDVDPSVYKRK